MAKIHYTRIPVTSP